MRTFIIFALLIAADPYTPLLQHEAYFWRLFLGIGILAGFFMAVAQDIKELTAITSHNKE